MDYIELVGGRGSGKSTLLSSIRSQRHLFPGIVFEDEALQKVLKVEIKRRSLPISVGLHLAFRITKARCLATRLAIHILGRPVLNNLLGSNKALANCYSDFLSYCASDQISNASKSLWIQWFQGSMLKFAVLSLYSEEGKWVLCDESLLQFFRFSSPSRAPWGACRSLKPSAVLVMDTGAEERFQRWGVRRQKSTLLDLANPPGPLAPKVNADSVALEHQLNLLTLEEVPFKHVDPTQDRVRQVSEIASWIKMTVAANAH
jgi:hypothetical protein